MVAPKHREVKVGYQRNLQRSRSLVFFLLDHTGESCGKQTLTGIYCKHSSKAKAKALEDYRQLVIKLPLFDDLKVQDQRVLSFLSRRSECCSTNLLVHNQLLFTLFF